MNRSHLALYALPFFVLACDPTDPTQPLPVGTECPDLPCDLACEVELDADGCPTCQCVDPILPEGCSGLSEADCSSIPWCEPLYAYADGEAEDGAARPANPDDFVLPDPGNGPEYVGCQEAGQGCGELCEIYCPYGNVLDDEGCPTCACLPEPVSCEGRTEVDCLNDPTCYALYGDEGSTGSGGGPDCVCPACDSESEDPCAPCECEAGHTPDIDCADDDDDCPDVMAPPEDYPQSNYLGCIDDTFECLDFYCEIDCLNGYIYDDTGCPVCECNPEPWTDCYDMSESACIAAEHCAPEYYDVCGSSSGGSTDPGAPEPPPDGDRLSCPPEEFVACNPVSICPAIACEPTEWCEYGEAFDEWGCPTCECNPAPETCEGLGEDACIETDGCVSNYELACAGGAPDPSAPCEEDGCNDAPCLETSVFTHCSGQSDQ